MRGGLRVPFAFCRGQALRAGGVYCVVAATAMLVAACAVGRAPAPTVASSHAAQTVAAFEGAVNHPATSDCPQVLPANLSNPFGNLVSGPLTGADYTVVDCRTGDLLQEPFAVVAYNSRDKESQGVAVQYNGRLMAHVITNGAIDFYQFTGTSVCWSMQAGAYFAGVNITTGKVYTTVAAGEPTGPCDTPPMSVSHLGSTG